MEQVASKVLRFLDARCRVKDDSKAEFEMSHHIVVMGFNGQERERESARARADY